MLESQKKKKEVEETRLPGFKPTTLKFSGRQAGALTPALQLQTWPTWGTWLPQTRIFKKCNFVYLFQTMQESKQGLF